MCLLLIALTSNPSQKLVIAGNRDEYYDRPTAQARFWENAPELLAGMDLRAGGTWFGVTRQGRIAALTDYRDPASVQCHAPSRGELVSNFLLSQEPPAEYLDRLTQEADPYNGFNLIVGKADELYWYSNKGGTRTKLTPGIYGLSNHLLDTPWPKVVSCKKAFSNLLSGGKDVSPEDVLSILSDRSVPPDETLPDTGIGIEWEKILAPAFIASPTYGTRSSTVLLITANDQVTFIEKSYAPGSVLSTTRHKFQIKPTLPPKEHGSVS